MEKKKTKSNEYLFQIIFKYGSMPGLYIQNRLSHLLKNLLEISKNQCSIDRNMSRDKRQHVVINNSELKISVDMRKRMPHVIHILKCKYNFN